MTDDDISELAITGIPAPEYQNSAGRLLAILRALPEGESYSQVALKLFGITKKKKDIPPPEQAVVFSTFVQRLSACYQQFVRDIQAASEIPDGSKTVLLEGLSTLTELIYPTNASLACRPIQGAEYALLRMAASMLPAEAELVTDDVERIRRSAEQLRAATEDADIPASVKSALLEILRLSRNAVDQYSIYGPRGFRKALKRMLAELMEVLLHEGGGKSPTAPWWRMAVNHLKTVDDVVARLMKYQPLIEPLALRLIGSA